MMFDLVNYSLHLILLIFLEFLSQYFIYYTLKNNELLIFSKFLLFFKIYS